MIYEFSFLLANLISVPNKACISFLFRKKVRNNFIRYYNVIVYVLYKCIHQYIKCFFINIAYNSNM